MEANNAAALREALVQIVALARQDQPRYAIISTAETALAAPPRNCDVGTAKEQYQRYDKFCCSHFRIADNGSDNCLKCPFAQPACKLEWAQMPYEEGGAK